jgi:hypothetical protein
MYAHTRGFAEWLNVYSGHLLALVDLLTTTSNSLGHGERERGGERTRKILMAMIIPFGEEEKSSG